MNKKKYWLIVRILFVITVLLTFTPIITPNNKISPQLFGMPYTLWVGILQSIVLVILTWIGTKVHQFKE